MYLKKKHKNLFCCSFLGFQAIESKFNGKKTSFKIYFLKIVPGTHLGSPRPSFI